MSVKVNIENLVQDLQNGEEQALATIYDMYSDALYGLILKIVKDDGLAQDILQDCFVKIWQKAQTYDASKGSFFTWMLNVCRNKSIDELRKVDRHRKGKDEIGHATDYKKQGIERNIDTIGLKDIVDELPDDQKLIVEYLYFKGYTQQETSDELNIPLGTVKSRSRMAIKALKDSFVIVLLIWIQKNI
ncbi:sigma-70 family RNA polymerase sigma factor [Lishizhenia sp.]|uniref:RNA polymerase sigma factor n=1 Tax=Lishizhenia sp. TaxID=2497594 RepID=UPI00299D9BCE|nr:sigma-70 family RNA polymerase sigma factor [Lishizhenia sp.]MDX1445820.1 sigma-70 family RNA polymerase sigma factor [Lishizhenia sp.]